MASQSGWEFVRLTDKTGFAEWRHVATKQTKVMAAPRRFRPKCSYIDGNGVCCDRKALGGESVCRAHLSA